jgi:AraC-like DNA-binding protein
MGELTDGLAGLDALLGKDAERLAGRLTTARTWDDRFDMLRTMLCDRVGRRKPDARGCLGVARTARQRRPRIAHLVREANTSHRHLVRRFHDEIGMTPKAVARLLRQGRPLAQVASEGGYSDQAHLHREFRTLAGRTLGAMKADLSNTPATPAS